MLSVVTRKLLIDESGITDGGGGTYRSKNLVIRSNYCENVGNAAICPSDYENALIEYNVANGCNSGPNGNVPIWWEHGQKTICQFLILRIAVLKRASRKRCGT